VLQILGSNLIGGSHQTFLFLFLSFISDPPQMGLGPDPPGGDPRSARQFLSVAHCSGRFSPFIFFYPFERKCSKFAKFISFEL
jgi:hypothetical protein